MKVYVGSLNKLGRATVWPKGVEYSVIQIGNVIIKDVCVVDAFDAFFRDGLQVNDAIEVFVARKVGFSKYVVAAKMLGKLYVDHSALALVGPFLGLIAGITMALGFLIESASILIVVSPVLAALLWMSWSRIGVALELREAARKSPEVALV